MSYKIGVMGKKIDTQKKPGKNVRKQFNV